MLFKNYWKKYVAVFVVLAIVVTSSNFDFVNQKVFAATLSTPNITSPSDEASLSKGSVTVSWTSVSGANSYLFAAIDETTGSKFINNTTVYGTSYNISSSYLTEGHRYKVAVGAKSNTGEESNWDYSYFTIKVSPTPNAQVNVSTNKSSYTVGEKVNMNASLTGNGYSVTMFYVKTSTVENTPALYTSQAKTGSNVSDTWDTTNASAGTYYVYAVVYGSDYSTQLDKDYKKITVSAPTISFTSPSNGSTLTQTPVNLVWSKVDSAAFYKLSANGGTESTLDSNVTSQALDFQNGNYTMLIRAINGAGTELCRATVSFVVNVAKTQFNVAGTVSDANSAIANATVTLNGVSKTTNSIGYYKFENVLPGTYTLNVQANGHNPYSKSITVSNADINENVLMTLLPATYKLSGYITDSNTGVALSGVTVKLNNSSNWTTTTNSSGYYEFNSIQANTHILTATKTGYTSYQQNVDVNRDTTKNISLVKIETISFTNPTNGSTLTQTPVNLAWSKVDSAAFYKLSANGGTESTIDSNVTSQTLNFQNGNYTMLIRAINGAGTELCRATVSFVVNVAKTQFNVAGTVSDANSAIANATVTLNGVSKTTNSIGCYKFENVLPGTYTLNVQANGHNPFSKSITVSNADINEKVLMTLLPVPQASGLPSSLSVIKGNSVSLSGSVTCSGSIEKVSVGVVGYAGGDGMGTILTHSPNSTIYTLSNFTIDTSSAAFPNVGTYTLNIWAKPTGGSAVLVGSIQLTVNQPVGTPTVTLNTPSNGATYTLGSTINITATGANCDHMNAFVNGTATGYTVSGNNYSGSFTPTTPGTYTIYVIGRNTLNETDPGSKTANSATATVTVTDVPVKPPTGGGAPTGGVQTENLQAPTVILTSPENGTEVILGDSITIKGNGTNCDHIALFVDGSIVGGATQNGNNFSFDYIPAEGSHTIQLKGSNTPEGTTGAKVESSSSISIIVKTKLEVPTIKMSLLPKKDVYTKGEYVLIKGIGTDCDHIVLEVDGKAVDGSVIKGNYYEYSYKFSTTGEHTLRLKARNGADNDKKAPVSYSEIKTVAVTMKIKGVVYRKHTDKKLTVEKATVKLNNDTKFMKTTDNSGNFSFDSVTAGSEISIEKIGYDKIDKIYVTENSDTSDIIIELNYTDPKYVYTIKGSVIGKYSRKGIPGVSVEVVDKDPNFHWNGITDANGNYEIKGVGPDIYGLTFTKKGYTDESGNSPVTIKLNGISKDTTFDPVILIDKNNTFNITGKVTNGNKPIEGALVRIVGHDRFNDTTDSNGNYIIPGVAGNNNWNLETSCLGYATVNKDANVKSSDIKVDIQMRKNVIIEGTVYEGYYVGTRSDNPLTGAKVWLNDGIGYIKTPPLKNGLYQFANVMQTSHTLRAECKGYMTKESFEATYHKIINVSDKNKIFDIEIVKAENIPSANYRQIVKDAYAKGLLTDRTREGFAKDITRMEFTGLLTNLYLKLGGTTYELSSITNYSTYKNDSKPINRQEIAVMLYDMLKKLYPGLASDSKLNFSDKNKIADYALEAISYMSANGIITGNKNNLFLPYDNSSKEQAIKIIDAIYDKRDELKSIEYKLDIEMTKYSAIIVEDQDIYFTLHCSTWTKDAVPVLVEVAVPSLGKKYKLNTNFVDSENKKISIPFGIPLNTSETVFFIVYDQKSNILYSNNFDVRFWTKEKALDYQNQAISYLKDRGISVIGFNPDSIENDKSALTLSYNGTKFTIDEFINSSSYAVSEAIDYHKSVIEGYEAVLKNIKSEEARVLLKNYREMSQNTVATLDDIKYDLQFNREWLDELGEYSNNKIADINTAKKTLSNSEKLSAGIAFLSLAVNVQSMVEYYNNAEKKFEDHMLFAISAAGTIDSLVVIINSLVPAKYAKYIPQFFKNATRFSGIATFSVGSLAVLASLISEERNDLESANQILADSINDEFDNIKILLYGLYKIGVLDKRNNSLYKYDQNNIYNLQLIDSINQLTTLINMYESNINGDHIYGLGWAFWGFDRVEAEKGLIKVWRNIVHDISPENYYRAGYEGYDQLLQTLWD